MSLNAEAEAEFGAIDPDAVNTLEAVPQTHEASNSHGTPEALFGSNYVNGELPTLDKTFEIQTTETHRLIDMQSIHQSLRVRGLIGLEDAQAIDAITPGFINDDTNPAGYYTEHPSASNYTESVATVLSSLDSQYETTKTTLAALATRTATLGKDALHAMRPKYVTALTEINKAILDVLLAADITNIEQAVYAFGNGCRWSKISQISIYAMVGTYCDGDRDLAVTKEVRNSDFAVYIDRLEEVFKSPDALANFTDWLDHHKPVVWINRRRYAFAANNLLEPDLSSETAAVQVGNSSLGSFIHQLGTTRVRDWVVALQNTYQTYVGLAEGIPAQIQALDGQEATLADKLDRLIELNAVLNDARETMMGINRATGALFQVMCIVKDMMVQLRKAY